MTQDVAAFYDDLAAGYHLIVDDWEAWGRWQGEVLDMLIHAELGDGRRTLLDCSCGIGTQALALAERGYSVHATDLSPVSISRAEQEAERQGLTLTFGVADFRKLESQVEGTYDTVLTCDNALAHLMSEDDLEQAARSMATKLKPGGLLLASIRDYDQLAQEQPETTPIRMFNSDNTGGKRIVFQHWEWADDGRDYIMHMFIVRPSLGGADWQMRSHTTHLRAWQRHEIDAALEAAGLTDIRWHMTEDSGYYQPIVTACLR